MAKNILWEAKNTDGSPMAKNIYAQVAPNLKNLNFITYLSPDKKLIKCTFVKIKTATFF
jgi:hypothetical protein